MQLLYEDAAAVRSTRASKVRSEHLRILLFNPWPLRARTDVHLLDCDFSPLEICTFHTPLPRLRYSENAQRTLELHDCQISSILTDPDSLLEMDGLDQHVRSKRSLSVLKLH